MKFAKFLHVRVDDEIHQAAFEKSRRENRPISEVVRALITIWATTPSEPPTLAHEEQGGDHDAKEA